MIIIGGAVVDGRRAPGPRIVLSLREREFTEAARAVGNNDARIILRHLLPNAVAPIVVQATLDVANVIVLESTLSFLGFGIQPPTASWGNMLANAESNLEVAWWAAVFPGLCILSPCWPSTTSATACATRLTRTCANRSDRNSEPCRVPGACSEDKRFEYASRPAKVVRSWPRARVAELVDALA